MPKKSTLKVKSRSKRAKISFARIERRIDDLALRLTGAMREKGDVLEVQEVRIRLRKSVYRALSQENPLGLADSSVAGKNVKKVAANALRGLEANF